MDAFDIAASALTAQRLRMDTISSNLANVNTTRKSDGSIGAYHRKNVIFSPLLNKGADNAFPFATPDLPIQSGGSDPSALQARIFFNQDLSSTVGVSVTQITDDTKTPMRLVYEPTHPDANQDGYVEMPNINVVTEMVDMISASRAYEANVTALQATKGMSQAALQI